MTLSDLTFLLKQDIGESLRLRRVSGKRSTQKHFLRRFLLPIGLIIVGIVIIWVITLIGPFIWPLVVDVIFNDPGLGATIFNALMLFSFIGSVMVSVTTVGNSKRMEYMMIMPIPLRTLFLEKIIIIILYSSMLWLAIGTPIFIGFSIISPYPLAFLSVPLFVGLMLTLVTIGVSLGGLIGLGAARLVAGRRLLKQVGYTIITAAGIIGGSLWYASFYLSDGGVGIFDSLFQIARTLGFSSELTPGYTVSVLSLGVLVGLPFTPFQIIMPFVYVMLGILLVYANGVVSEEAHYSGWLAVESKRSSKEEIVIDHDVWDPQPFPGVRFNPTVSTSIWYNISSVKREARVLTNYLLGPLRFIIWILLPVFTIGEMFLDFLPIMLVLALVLFVNSYGLYFAGYETVYEGKNLLNLQLAAANMQDYIKGKVYSALPFSIAITVIMSIVILVLNWSFWPLLPAVFLAMPFLTLASGAISANAAAIGGDFRADRMITRQRGSSIQMPIRGWSMLRAQFVPMIFGAGGTLGIVVAGLLNPIYAYMGLPVFILISWVLFRHYTKSAGITLATIEATEYL